MSGCYNPSIVYMEDRCAGCGVRNDLEAHHVFGQANRKHSTEDGLIVFLCPRCHRDNVHGVHGQNKKLDTELKEAAQIAWMREYNKTKEDFLKKYGRNYL